MVAAALERADGRWFLNRRPLHKHHGGLWEFPGGKVEPGEVPVNALVRELHEELGIGCDASALAPAYFAQDLHGEGGRHTVILLYTLKAWRGTPVALEAGAIADWFLPEQIAALPKPPLDVLLCKVLFA